LIELLGDQLSYFEELIIFFCDLIAPGENLKSADFILLAFLSLVKYFEGFERAVDTVTDFAEVEVENS
jgi:hypothetical protein